jgi:hypothetical protein
VFCYFLYLFKCVSGLSVFAVSGDVFYTLSLYLRTLRTMSRFSWGRGYWSILKKIDNIDDNKNVDKFGFVASLT